MKDKVLMILGALILALGLFAGVLVSTNVSNAQVAPTQVNGTAICHTDSQGYCKVAHSAGVKPARAQVTASYYGNATRPFFLGVVHDSYTVTDFKVRALFASNSPVANNSIEFNYILYFDVAVPPTTTTTSTTTTTTTTTTTSPPPAGFPTAANTGVPAGTQLTTVNGDLHATTDVDAVHVTGMIFIEADHVSVNRSKIDQSIVNDAMCGDHNCIFTITDSDIGPDDCSNNGRSLPIGVGYSNYTATRLHLHGHEDGFRAGGPNITIKDSYVLICSPAASNDSDGVQDFPSTQHIVIDHNTFDMNHAQGFTAPISVHSGPNNGGSSDVTITNNLMAGVHDSTYTLNTWPQAGHGSWVIKGNRIQQGTWVFGPWNTEANCQFVDDWSDNDIVTLDNNYGVTGTVVDNAPCPA